MTDPILLDVPDQFESAHHEQSVEDVEANVRQAHADTRAGFALEARLKHNRIAADGALSDSLCFARPS
jgi:hypothetical protein